MNAYNPISTLHKLTAAGFKQSQAEALAEELHLATTELVTKDDLTKALDAQANRLTLRIGAAMGVMLTLAVTLSKFLA